MNAHYCSHTQLLPVSPTGLPDSNTRLMHNWLQKIFSFFPTTIVDWDNLQEEVVTAPTFKLF